MYDDECKTCRATYATLCIYGLESHDVTRSLGLAPTDSFHPGELRHGASTRHHAWFLTSKDASDSKDLRRHLDWILDQLVGRRSSLRDLADRGARIEMFCYWLSENGHGGPTISTEQTKKLAELELELSFDVYLGARA